MKQSLGICLLCCLILSSTIFNSYGDTDTAQYSQKLCAEEYKELKELREELRKATGTIIELSNAVRGLVKDMLKICGSKV
jgi:hypothetical protein